MAENEQAEDRTEAATARRLEQARESGKLPISRDVTVLGSLTGAAIGIVVLAPDMMQRLAGQLAEVIGTVDRVQIGNGSGLGGPIMGALTSAGLLIAAIALPAAGCAVGSVLLQTQFYIGGAPLHFDFARISPIAGFARIVSTRNLIEFLKSCARLAVVSLLAWLVLARSPAAALASIASDLDWLIPAAFGQVETLAKPLLIVLALIAGMDVLLVRFQYARSLRMSREQVRLESRESEGDPLIKAKLRRIRAQRARRRMMAKVKTADVVITNPTHYAVALSYDRDGGAAPRVVAKGADFVAARIREEAEAHKIPIVPSPPLARALYAVELDAEIPTEHYRAVAEVIAYVWKLSNRVGSSAR